MCDLGVRALLYQGGRVRLCQGMSSFLTNSKHAATTSHVFFICLALQELHGKQFDGRAVVAMFLPESDFANLEALPCHKID